MGTPRAGRDPSLVFVACVEPGPLEAQVVLLCRSIRDHAGRHAGGTIRIHHADSGVPLRPGTTSALAALGAQLHRVRRDPELAFYPHAAKLVATAAAEAEQPEDVVVFLDSDTFFVAEPSELELEPGIDAAVRPVNARGVGSSGAGDPNEPFWTTVRRVCAVHEPPLVRAVASGEPVRGYFNAGLVALRRDARLGAQWLSDLRALLRARALPPNGLVNNMDQVALAATLARRPEAVRVLDDRHNYPLILRDRLPEPGRSRPLGSLVHVHHFGLLHDPDGLAALRPPIEPACPVRAWLAPQLPLEPVLHGRRTRPRITVPVDGS